MIASSGRMTINGANAQGSATLLEGAVVETAAAQGRIQIGTTRLQLSPRAKAKVSASRVVLERGYADVLVPGSISIQARSLLVKPDTAQTKGRVALHGDKLVQVAATGGSWRVFNRGGVLVSRLEPGDTLDFEPVDLTDAPPSTAVGCVLKKDGKFIIFDQATRLVIELRGTGFEKEWGNRVQADGTARAAGQPGGSAQALFVTTLTRLETGGCQEVANAIQAQVPQQQAATPPRSGSAEVSRPSVGGGMSAGTKVAIAVAAVGGGAGGAVLATQKSRSN
jgi:hypothetical protein